MRTEENGSQDRTSVRLPAEQQDLDFSDFMEGLVIDTKAYVRAERDHLTLRGIEKASLFMVLIFRNGVFMILFGTAILFLNVALAIYLGDQLDSRPWGYVIVAGTYLLLLGAFQLWWSKGGRDRFLLNRINDLSNDE